VKNKIGRVDVYLKVLGNLRSQILGWKAPVNFLAGSFGERIKVKLGNPP
jgi:hypothetical protein